MLTNARAGDLVAVRLPPGVAWLEVLREAWEREVAVLPLDVRLTAPETEALLARARPGSILDADGLRPLEGGAPAEGVALVAATSGAAGRPKLAELTREGVAHALHASAERLGAGPGEPWLACLPPGHIGGLLVYLRGAILGAPLEVLDRFDPVWVARSGAAFASLVPTMVRRIAHARLDLSAYRAVLVGGAAPRGLPAASSSLGKSEAGRGAVAAPWPLVATYGQTETCGGVAYDGVPLGGAEVRVSRGGEIEVRGPALMRGYRLDPEATEAAFARGGWLRTGDAGELAEGRLVVHGRLDDAITTGGETVWPDEVEEALASHGGIAEVAVAGVPDPDRGERVVAYVVPVRAAPTPEGLRDFLGGVLARYKHPREVVVMEELPRTRSGKVRRSALPAAGRAGGSGGPEVTGGILGS